MNPLACTRCGIDAGDSAMWPLTGTGPVCADLGACGRRQLVTRVEEIKLRWPWPDDLPGTGMKEAYERMEPSKLERVGQCIRMSHDELLEGAARYDRCWRHLIYVGIAICGFYPDIDDDRLVAVLSDHAEADGGLGHVMCQSLLEEIAKLRVVGFVEWALSRGSTMVRAVADEGWRQ